MILHQRIIGLEGFPKAYILKMKSKGIREKVAYNTRSQPIGKEVTNYTTYVGALAHNGRVPITCPY